jgi:hypothetical protein
MDQLFRRLALAASSAQAEGYKPSTPFLFCSHYRWEDRVYKSDMDPFIIFLCPAVVAKMADEINYRSGRIDGLLPADVKDAESMLRERAGYLVTVEFPLPVDPLDAPEDAVEAVATSTNGGFYAYVIDEYTEPAKGVRVKGRVVFREGGRERRIEIPSEHGAPALDVPTLLAGGLTPEEAYGLIARFKAAP